MRGWNGEGRGDLLRDAPSHVEWLLATCESIDDRTRTALAARARGMTFRQVGANLAKRGGDVSRERARQVCALGLRLVERHRQHQDTETALARSCGVIIRDGLVDHAFAVLDTLASIGAIET